MGRRQPLRLAARAAGTSAWCVSMWREVCARPIPVMTTHTRTTHARPKVRRTALWLVAMRTTATSRLVLRTVTITLAMATTTTLGRSLSTRKKGNLSHREQQAQRLKMAMSPLVGMDDAITARSCPSGTAAGTRKATCRLPLRMLTL